MTYTKEKRYLVSGMYDYGQVDVLVSQSGEIKLWSVEDDEEYSSPSNDEVFFVDKETYEDYKASQKPANIEQIKKYLHYIFVNEDIEKLKEILPGRLYRCYKDGYQNSFHFMYQDFEKIKKAIGGLLEIGPHTIRPSEVVCVTHLKDNKTEICLSNGKIITSDDEIERTIINAMFGGNVTGKYLNR